MTPTSCRVRVKICGVRSPQEAVQAAEAGADAVGLNFYSASSRFVSWESARAILAALPAFVEAVAIVVRPEREFLHRLVCEWGFRTIQIHEGEPLPDWPNVRYILAFGVAEPADLEHAESRLESELARGVQVAAVLLDARVPGQLGGTGRTPPWSLVAQFSRRRPLILAGGLTAENVSQAIRLVQPWAVDVASGVEMSPGVKDPNKVRQFLRAVWETSSWCSTAP